MKKKIFLLLNCALCIVHCAFSQPGQWTWMHGDSTVNNGGNFGVQGVSSPTNEPPAIYEPAAWTDLNGDFWLFGGLTSTYSVQSDLWKYSPSTNEWTWMKGPGTVNYAGNYGVQGVASATNEPPGISWGLASWVDQNNDLWMFGGMSGGAFSDLWKYNIASNEWTWMKGPGIANQTGIYGTQGISSPTNNPGSRWECVASWTDLNGDLWLFGGYNGTVFNDLWKYTLATNEWTWTKGSSSSGQLGTYGIKGVEDPANTPGARMAYSHWIDGTGNLWLFAGYDGGGNFYNDMWRYNPSTNNWAWITGSSSSNASGLYIGTCLEDSTLTPGNRAENRAAWVDQNGNFWEFGGTQDLSFGTCRNDLWMYCTVRNEWTWINGDTTLNPTGLWGIKGVASPSNKPNGRAGTITFKDQSGQLYLFGGTSNGWPNMYNDLWKFTIDPACALCSSTPVALFSSPNHICPGTCTDFNNLSINATSYLWTFAGASPSTSTDVAPTNICYNTPGTYSVSLIATNANGSDTLTLNNYITVYPYPPPQGIAQSGDTLIANQGAVSYQWYYSGNLIPGATDYFYVASQSGDYNVVATDANGCEVEAAIFDVVASVQSLVNGQLPFVYPNPVVNKCTIHSRWLSGSQFTIGAAATITVYNTLGVAVQSEIRTWKPEMSVDVSSLSSGIYWFQISSVEKSIRTKFIKQ